MNELISKVKILDDRVEKTYFNNYYFSKDLYINEFSILKHLQKNGYKNCPSLISYNSKNYEYTIVMEKINGSTISKIKKINDRLKIFKKLIYAVKKLHSLNVVHNNLSPNNVMFDLNKVYIIDFSVATHIRNINIVNATNGYSAIEKYSKKYISDFSADIYSLSSILLYFLTNKTPMPSFERYFFYTDEYILNEKVDAFFKKTYCLDKEKRIRDMDEYILEYERIENELLYI